ncbi:MAG: TonB family protein [Limnohabitans sp.]
MKHTSSHRTLQWALGISVALHVLLLTLRFAAPQTFNWVFQDTPLEVVLVNARSNERPKDAQALAQVSLAGGGNVTEVRMSSSPLPADMANESGADFTEVQRQIEALKVQQLQLLSRLKAELADLSRDDAGDAHQAPDRQAREERKQQLSRQLAQIEQRVDQAQGAPRKRYISPATKETAYALYYDKLRRTIEAQGTQNFPQVRGEKLYGKLTMVITVSSQGELLQTEVASSSRNPLLDERAVAIVRSAAPFDPFSAKMRRQADQIVVVSRFMFSRDDTLSSRMLAPDN